MQVYSSWSAQRDGIKKLVAGCRRIAMQYSPDCAIPYVSLVDAGTLELVRGTGVEVSTSANLVQLFEARWSAEQLEMHLEAADGWIACGLRRFRRSERRSAAGRSHHRMGHKSICPRRFRARRLVHRSWAHRGGECQYVESALRTSRPIDINPSAKAMPC